MSYPSIWNIRMLYNKLFFFRSVLSHYVLTRCDIKGKLSWAVNLKKTAWTFQVWFKAASMQGKTARIWRAFGGERDNSRQKSRFRERKVVRKPGIRLPQTNLLKCMHSSWQCPFKWGNLKEISRGDSSDKMTLIIGSSYYIYDNLFCPVGRSIYLGDISTIILSYSSQRRPKII